MSGLLYPAGVPHRPPRPRGNNSLAGITVGALLGLIITEHPAGAVTGGAIGGAISNQPTSLEAALRSYFTGKGLDVIGFYRHGPMAAQILFRHGEHYWMVTSRAPDSPDWTLDSLDDWLYGDIVEIQLPAKLAQIGKRMAS
jgi:hypothetical protein